MSDTFINSLPFQVSEFQKCAFEATENNSKHVLVTAHTGSGKTLPAEFSIQYFTNQNKKVIYTSPIKALSNQKFEEFSRKFPNINVGIMTGDIKHNPTADLIIMTTEILQNYLFKKKNNIGILDFEIDIENDLECVIFDEVHYIDDPDRGTVWEQVMIMLPDHVKFVMLYLLQLDKKKFSQNGLKQLNIAKLLFVIQIIVWFHFIFMTSLHVMRNILKINMIKNGKNID